MLKFLDYATVFQEVPDEVTLALEITNCPHKCKNCHSPHLRENVGIELTEKVINEFTKSKLITCVCLMGGDSDHNDIKRIADLVHKANLKMAFYSGDEDIDNELIPYLDYYKVGPYIEEKGPLNNKNTNQRLYKIDDKKLIDITYRFWK